MHGDQCVEHFSPFLSLSSLLSLFTHPPPPPHTHTHFPSFLFTFPNIPFPLTFLPPFQPSPFFLSTSPSPLFSELAPCFLYYEEGREGGKKMQWVEHTPGTQYGDFLATYGLHVRDQLDYSTWLNTKMLTSVLRNTNIARLFQLTNSS